MTLMAYRHPWIFEAVGRPALDASLASKGASARPATDVLAPYGLPGIWTNVDTGAQVAPRVVWDVAAGAVDVSVLVWVPSISRFVEVSDAFLAAGVPLVMRPERPEDLRDFARRIIDAINESLGGGAPLADSGHRV